MRKKLSWILSICLLAVSAVFLVACDLTLPSDPSGHTHDYSKVGYDSTSHWYYCKEDNIKKEGSEENHFDNNSDGYCDVCNFDMSDVHVHDYSAYNYDSECHWRACSVCNAKDPTGARVEHLDDNKDGKCDVCGYGMPLPEEENISFESGKNEILRIQGTIPSGVGTVKLRYYDKDKPENGGFIENVAVDKNSYIFLISYDKLTYTDDYFPIYIFDLYAYKSSNSEPQITKIKNNNYLEYTYYKNSSGKIYWNVLSLSDDTERLAIQPEDAYDFAVTDIRLEEKEKNLYMYVSAIGPKETNCVKLKATFSRNSTFVDDTSEDLGKFEFCINLSTFDEGHIYFDIYEYEDKEPSDLNNYSSGHRLQSKGIISNGETKIVGDKQFTVIVGSEANYNDVVSIKITNFGS